MTFPALKIGRQLPMAIMILLLPCVVSQPSASAQTDQEDRSFDTVEYRKDIVSPRQILVGIITEMDQRQVRIDLGTNGSRSVARDQILSIRLAADPDVAAANQWVQSGKFRQAADQWEKISKKKGPDWLTQHAREQLCQCQLASSQLVSALATYLRLCEETPAIPWAVAPLAWGNVSPNPVLQRQLTGWLQDKHPAKQLLAASYLLQNPETTGRARQTLQALTTNSDRNVVALAETQLWRLETDVDAARLAELQAGCEAIPEALRAGPLLQLARLKKNAGRPKDAVADFLRVATMYPQQYSLVLLGLDQAYLTLNGLGDGQAKQVGEWLKQRFPDSVAASAIPEDL